MANDRQILANRLNALKSTGPRSSAGKARSRQNAVKHGLTAQQLLLPGEAPTALDELRQSVFDRLAPEGALEIQLVERVVSLVWRLRRVPGFEVALFAWTKHAQAQAHDTFDPMIDPRTLTTSNRFLDNAESGPDSLEMGRTFEALLSADLMCRLSRYEVSLQGQLASTLKELRELQATRPDFCKPQVKAGLSEAQR